MIDNKLCIMLGVYGLAEEKYPFSITTMDNGKQRDIYYDPRKTINQKVDSTPAYNYWTYIMLSDF